jgi:hypothetical protein
VEKLLEDGYTWMVDADLKSYLDSCSYYTLAAEAYIPHLKKRVFFGIN